MKFFKHFLVIFRSFLWALRFQIRYAMNSREYLKKISEVISDGDVTVVITSCNRPNQLEKTIKSFLKFNTFPIAKFIVIEDGGSQKALMTAKDLLGEAGNVFILNSNNLGQLNSIDIAYQQVNTEFIFHLEDDWEFTSAGFIEKSISTLRVNPNYIFLSLRAMTDQNNHPFVESEGEFNRLLPFWKGVWVGFGFNPSLRRRADYIMIGSCFGRWNKRETSIGIFYYFHKKRVAVLKNNISYVKHTGGSCSTELTHRKA